MNERILSDGQVLLIRECPSCGVIYGITESYHKNLCDKAGNLWCVNGCELGWSVTKADRLAKTLRATKASEEQAWACCREAQESAQTLRRSRDGMKGALVKTQNQLKGADS